MVCEDSKHVQHLWSIEGEVARARGGHQGNLHSSHHLPVGPRLPLEHRLQRLLLLILDRQGCQPALLNVYKWKLLLTVMLQTEGVDTPLILVQ